MKRTSDESRGVTATLLISCPDRRGIVAGVAGFLCRNGGNIVHADQHTDPELGVFLQRVEWELDGFAIPRGGIGRKFSPLAEKYGMAWRLSFSDRRPRVAVLVSRAGHCLYDLLARRGTGELRAEVPLVIGNHPDLAPAAKSFGVPFVHVPGDGPAAERKIRALLRAHGIGLVVLARYMRMAGPGLVREYAGRIINIHHSFLPSFAGARPYHQAYERGVKIIGATAHYVTDELDAGPIIEQDVVRVSHRDSVGDLVRKGRDLERLVLARAVHLHLSDRVLVYGNKTAVFD